MFQAIHQFTSHGRDFAVLWKSSVAYLRADGRTIAVIEGGLREAEAIVQAVRRAELFQIDERQQEEGLVKRLFEWPKDGDLARVAVDYEVRRVALGEGVATHLVWASFNHNAYVSNTFGWRFCGAFETAVLAECALPTWFSEQSAACGRPVLQRRHLPQKWTCGWKLEPKVIVWLMVALPLLLGFAWGVSKLFNHWPWMVLVLCVIVCCAAWLMAWRERRPRLIVKEGGGHASN